MNNLMSTSLYKIHPFLRNSSIYPFHYPCRRFRVQSTSSNELDNDTTALKVSKQEEIQDPNATGLNQGFENQETEENLTSLKGTTSTSNAAVGKDLKKVVQKTAATFAPRASVASKNPAVPGTALYTVFEVQAYASMLLGGALSFNFIFPSNDPDIWRLMGMWSIWMFTIPSLRARDCSKNEKEALNYLFLLVPLINVIIPFFWKSFAIVWSADVVAFFAMYAWKLGWLQKGENE